MLLVDGGSHAAMAKSGQNFMMANDGRVRVHKMRCGIEASTNLRSLYNTSLNDNYILVLSPYHLNCQTTSTLVRYVGVSTP